MSEQFVKTILFSNEVSRNGDLILNDDDLPPKQDLYSVSPGYSQAPEPSPRQIQRQSYHSPMQQSLSPMQNVISSSQTTQQQQHSSRSPRLGMGPSTPFAPAHSYVGGSTPQPFSAQNYQQQYQQQQSNVTYGIQQPFTPMQNGGYVQMHTSPLVQSQTPAAAYTTPHLQVTIFGFPQVAINSVLAQFKALGQVSKLLYQNHWNFVIIEYASMDAKVKALELNLSVIAGYLIGVLDYIPPSIQKQVQQSSPASPLANALGTYGMSSSTSTPAPMMNFTPTSGSQNKFPVKNTLQTRPQVPENKGLFGKLSDAIFTWN